MAADEPEQPLEVDGLADEVAYAEALGAGADVGLRREQDDGNRGQALVIQLGTPKAGAVEPGHAQVEYDDGGPGLDVKVVERFHSIRRLYDAEAMRRQDSGDRLAKRPVVVDDQDGAAVGHARLRSKILSGRGFARELNTFARSADRLRRRVDDRAGWPSLSAHSRLVRSCPGRDRARG